MIEAHLKNEKVEKIRIFSTNMRRKILQMALNAGAGSSHLGGGLSIVDIVATLYSAIMKLDPRNPYWPDRDRFILSKGHGVLGYYTALQQVGLVSDDELMSFEKKDSILLGHPIMNREKGIEFSTGSLGMGLSLGIGVGLAGKRRKRDYKVFVILGDGECNEGSVWEAALAAPHFQLDNLTVIIDRNHLQQTGFNKDIMPMGDLKSKWESFGWDTYEVNGHDLNELLDTFTKPSKQNCPRAIVAQTIKGKGFSFMENNNDWHHAPLSKDLYEKALLELN